MDYGERGLDARIGRWLAVDPLQSKSPGMNPYNFAFNSPIIFNDPDGKYPKIVITNETTGFTIARVYGVQQSGCTYVVVPTYKMIIYDVKANGKTTVIGTHSVTRDGWYNLGNDKLVNRATEPVGESITVDATPTVDYGKTKGAYALAPVTAVPSPPEWDNFANGGQVPTTVKREDPGTANSVMIHVGGYYEHPDGSYSVGGTYGCFGVVEPDQIFKTEADALDFGEKILDNTSNGGGKVEPVEGITSSNSEQNKVVSDVNRAVQKGGKRGETNNQNIKVEIQKRGNVQAECD